MKIQYITEEKKFFQATKENQIAVVDFYSTECPPCEKLAPIFERLAEKYHDVQFIKIFRQGNRPLAEKLGVKGSPTLLFYKNGNIEKERLVGEINESDFTKVLDKITNYKYCKDATEKKIIAEHDLCIIGSGPAGLTAAVYAARYKIDQIIIGELTGGLMTSSHKICNYPSEIEISGMNLTQKMQDHVAKLNIPFVINTVKAINPKNNSYEIVLANNEIIYAKTVLLSTGTKHRHLDLANEEKLIGRGISYCATCDGMFYANKKVAVIGGSDSATTAALYLAEIANEVYQIYRGDALRGEIAWIEQALHHPKIKILFNTNVTAVDGEEKLENIILDHPFKDSSTLKVDGLFIEVGSEPDNKLFKDLPIETDERGYIKVKADQSTTKRGIWAAGDITNGSNSFRQIVTACSEGAIAAQSIFTYLQKNE